MNGGHRPLSLSVCVLVLASLMIVTSCAKKSGSSARASLGNGAESTAGGSAGSGPAGAGVAGGTGSARFGPGSGNGADGASGAGLMAAAATGTTIPALPSPKEFGETGALRDVYFEFDRYDIRPQDAKILEGNAQWLRGNASAALLLEGHADERGTNEYNLALGERRAKATRDHLVALGVDPARITVISYGEERPFCADRTEPCWAQNRRAHFLVKQ